MTEYSNSPLRAPLARARGLGSAKAGLHHWWLQRLSALALIPLSVWFIIALVTRLVGGNAPDVAAWLANPLVALALAALSIAAFMHARLGLQVIIEDYVHTHARKLALVLFKDTVAIGLLACTLAAIAKLHFVGM